MAIPHSHTKEILTIETNNFSNKEAQKLFVFLCKNVLEKKMKRVRKTFKKNGQPVTWDDVMRVVDRYGLQAKLIIEVDEENKTSLMRKSEVDKVRLEHGLKALPKHVIIERYDPLNP